MGTRVQYVFDGFVLGHAIAESFVHGYSFCQSFNKGKLYLKTPRYRPEGRLSNGERLYWGHRMVKFQSSSFFLKAQQSS